jgi:hypothetical protein
MKIACLGWGSLVWNPGELPIERPWQKDGPLLPIEFARHSSGDRITLVLVEGFDSVHTLWTMMLVSDLLSAKRELAARERIPRNDMDSYIGFWTTAKDSGGLRSAQIGAWATEKRLEGVVWTALPPRFHHMDGKVPSEADVVDFLRSLDQAQGESAEEYIRNAPRQIDTRYRRIIEEELGWLPRE